jgi:hypothetical protein
MNLKNLLRTGALLSLSTILVLGITALASAVSYSWEIETILEGGYDYSYSEVIMYEGYDEENPNEDVYGKYGYHEVDGADVCSAHDIAIDTNGFEHIAFEIAGIGTQYATNKSGAWVVETVYSDSTTQCSSDLALVLDNKDYPHVLFAEDGTQYATKNSGKWHVWKLDSSQSRSWMDLEIDAKNTVHAVYANGSMELQYTYFMNPHIPMFTSSGSFSMPGFRHVLFEHSETIDVADPHSDPVWGFGLKDIEMEIDEDNIPYVNYYLFEEFASGSYLTSVRSSNRSSGAWSTPLDLISTTPLNIYGLDLEIDTDGELHMMIASNFMYREVELYDYDSSSGAWKSQYVSLPASVEKDLEFSRNTDGSYNIYYFGGYSPNHSLVYAFVTDSTGGGSYSYVDYSTIDTVHAGSVSIARDSINFTHLLYNDLSGSTALLYANNAITDLSEDIDTPDHGEYNDLAVDNFGTSHIAYYQYATDPVSGDLDGNLMYAYSSASGWVTDYADSSGDVGQYVSISTDSNGYAHILYYESIDSSGSTVKNLRYATNRFMTTSTGSWANLDIDGLNGIRTTSGESADEVGMFTSSYMDDNDTLHVSYYDETNGQLKYGYVDVSSMSHTGLSSMNWTVETVDSSTSADVGKYSSIVYDEVESQVHISYYDETNQRLLLASGISGAWTAGQVIDDTANMGKYSSLAVDLAGKLHVSYYNTTDKDLQYASASTSGVTAGSYTWDVEVVDSDGRVGMYSDIAVDKYGNAYISYQDDDSDDLLYASNNDGPWRHEILSDNDVRGQDTSIFVDAYNVVRLVFCANQPNETLTYLEF